jgi:hypothetical protein
MANPSDMPKEMLDFLSNRAYYGSINNALELASKDARRA